MDERVGDGAGDVFGHAERGENFVYFTVDFGATRDLEAARVFGEFVAEEILFRLGGEISAEEDVRTASSEPV